ncbi:MAG TPA: sulfite exporter TauE/SafE family protein [Bacteroidales bacterium]|nr:sulfite exporter TauE/SafE family protein [Bacteroidales bacterium]
MSISVAIALLISGVLVGFINTLAGGGSVISLSLFLFLGLPVDVANGTNRIAIVLQNLSSVSTFRRSKLINFSFANKLAIPAVIGSILGAQLAVNIDKALVERVFAVMLVFVALFMLINPKHYLHGRPAMQNEKVSPLTILIFFLIGLYGGFIQVGVGYFLLAALVMGAGLDLVKANAVKVWIVLLYSPVALAVFIANGAVHWSYGLMHGLGNIGGAILASRMAIQKGVNFVRWVIIAVIAITSMQLTGLFSFSDLISWFMR